MGMKGHPVTVPPRLVAAPSIIKPKENHGGRNHMYVALIIIGLACLIGAAVGGGIRLK